MRYPIPAKETRKEQIVVNSRFIATIAPAFNVAEAMNILMLHTMYPRL